jgi:hypothetical protein
MVLGIIKLVEGFYELRRDREAAKQWETVAVPQYKKGMQRWDEAWYCKRNDGVFSLDEGIFYPREKFQDYLYQEMP